MKYKINDLKKRKRELKILYKRCTKCNEILPLKQFGKNKKMLDGTENQCKKCRSKKYTHICKICGVEFINDKTFTFKMYTTENFKEVVKLFKNKEIGTLQIIFIDRTGVKTMGMNLYDVSIKSIYPVKLDYTSVENVEFIVTAEYSEIGYE